MCHFRLGAREFDHLQILRREVSREAGEEEPSDDEWEKHEDEEDEQIQIEKEAAEAKRRHDKLEQELDRLQRFVDEGGLHSVRLPCIAHKVCIYERVAVGRKYPCRIP